MSLFDILFGWLRPPKNNGAEVAAVDTDEDVNLDDMTDSTGDQVQITITGLNGDEGIKASKEIAKLLKVIPTVNARRSKERIEANYGNSTSILNAIEATRDVLYVEGGEAGICGAAPDDGSAVALWFVTRAEPPENAPGVFTPDDVLLTPSEFPPAVQLAIAGATVAAGSAGSPANAQKLAPALKYYAEHLEPLLDTSLNEIPPSHLPGFLVTVGNVLATRARQTKSVDLYETAASAYKDAALSYDPEFAPLSWAGAKSHVALALQAIASLDGSFQDSEKAGEPSGSIAEALQAYTEIMETLSEEKAPRAWAQANIDFAMLTYRRAVVMDKDKPFREALKSLQAAQAVFTRQAMPRKWSDITNNMGLILMTMGENRGDDGILKHAIGSFEQSLQVRRRETVPKLWAQTSNNLGAASFALAKRTYDKDAMNEAAKSFEGARDVFEELGYSQRVQVIEKNLSRVKRLMETS